MMSKKIPVCMIGAGRIGLKLEFDKKRIKPATHYGMWVKNKRFELKGICDNQEIEKRYKKKIKKKIIFYKDFKKMILAEKPKVVSISTWKDSHFDITNKCLDLGVKVIVLEKPLANNINQAKKLVNKIKKKKAKVIVNHRRRFDDDIINLKRKLENNIIGEIIQVSSFYVYGLLTTGTHLIDTLRMLMKNLAGDIVEVSGIKNTKGNFKPKDDENYDANLRFKNGLIATIQNLDMKSYDNFDIHIFGRKGKILISGIGRNILMYKVIQSPEHTGFTELATHPLKLNKSKPRLQFNKLSHNALECLSSKKTPLCSAKESYIDMVVIEKIIQSAKKKSKFLKIKI